MVTLAYQLDERVDGAPDAPLIVLGSALGTTGQMWARQIPALTRDFRVLRFDHRGHGRSAVPTGDYDLDDLGGDVLELLDHVGAAAIAYVGTSLGGMVGIWLATHAADRVERLVLICTSAYLPPASKWTDRAAAVRAGGLDAVAAGVVERWFTPAFREREPGTVDEMLQMLRGAPPAGYASCAVAIGGMDQRAHLPSITAPTLVISAANDEAIPPEHGRDIAAAVPGARFELVPGAHQASIESADLVNRLLIDFLVASL